MAEEVIDRADEVVDAAAPALPAALDPLRSIASGLDALAAEGAAVANLDLATTAGDKAERAFRLKCVTLRADLDRAYEAVNRPLLTLQRDARALVAEIKARVLALEEPADQRIKAREAEKEAERQRRIEAERQRLLAIRDRIEQIGGVARRAIGKPSADVEAKLKLVVAIDIDDSFAELRAEAERVHAETLSALRELLEATQAQESEAARQQAERERLARAAAFQARLHDLRSITIGMASRSSQAIQAAIESLEAVEIGADWEEFGSEAFAERAGVLDELGGMLAAARERERVAAEQAAEAERQAAEAARLERQRQQQAREEEERQRQLATQQRALELDRVGHALLKAVERVGNARADAELARWCDSNGAGPLSSEIDDCIAALDALQPETTTEPADAPRIEPSADDAEAGGATESAAAEGSTEPVSDQVDDGRRIKLGDVCRRLGFTVDRGFVEGTLGIAAAGTEKRAVLFRVCDWPRLVDALAAHVSGLRNVEWQ